MKLQYCSDLHLEFGENFKHLHKKPLEVTGDILLLAGDIIPFAILDEGDDFFDYVSDNYEQVYWVPGNHEYYKEDIHSRSGSFIESIRKNVFLLNNKTIEIGDTKLIFSTMWSKISPVNQYEIQRRLSDFHMIKNGAGKLTIADFNLLHEQSMDFLKPEILPEAGISKVVITHHVPTFMNYPPAYKNDSLNEAFAVECYDLIENSGVNFWIYGHHHSNRSDFKIGNTVLTTNQLGYVQHGEHRSFVRGKALIL